MPKRRTTAKKTARQGKTTDYLIELALDSILDTDIPGLRSSFLLEHELTNSHYLLKHQMDDVIGCYGTFNIELLKTFPLKQVSEEEYREQKELASDRLSRIVFIRLLLQVVPDDPTLNQSERLSVALLKTLFKKRVEDWIVENKDLIDENKENIPPCP